MSFQHDEKILVAAPAAYSTPPAQARFLMESCRRQGIELTLLGGTEPMRSHREKTQLVADYLRHHPEYRYVLQIDFKDIVFCATLAELYDKYRRSGHDIVAASDRFSWPLKSHAELAPRCGSLFRYLNAGSIFATSESWLDAWETMEQKKDRLGGNPEEIGCYGRHIFNCDQAAWSDLYVHGEADIAIDSRCDLFLTLASVDCSIHSRNQDLSFEGRRVVMRQSGARPCLIHGNAGIRMEPWARYVLDPPTVWIWPLIEKIREAPLSVLSDVVAVESLILELGLHDPLEGRVPPEQLPYCGMGLGIWQRPREFAEYLLWLSSRPPLRSYLEIGVNAGGSFITTVEYLRRFHPLPFAVALDIQLHPNVCDYAAQVPGVHAIQGDRSSVRLQHLLSQAGPPDVVLIDGDHSSEAVRRDWEYARNIGRYIVLHDIATDGLPGVRSLWDEIKSNYRCVQEFIRPDPGFISWAGLGLVDLAYGTRMPSCDEACQ